MCSFWCCSHHKLTESLSEGTERFLHARGSSGLTWLLSGGVSSCWGGAAEDEEGAVTLSPLRRSGAAGKAFPELPWHFPTRHCPARAPAGFPVGFPIGFPLLSMDWAVPGAIPEPSRGDVPLCHPRRGCCAPGRGGGWPRAGGLGFLHLSVP